ncbi:MAG: hypothetical protein ACJAQT_004593 [Akkermansiaceae bacterium]|jgi:hypothetical protein
MNRLQISAAILWASPLIIVAQEWPKTFTPAANSARIELVSKDDESFHYKTESYQINSAIELEVSLLKNFASSAESVAAVIQKIPLPLFSPLKKGNAVIEITADAEAYGKAGGAPGTAGYYDGRSGRVVVQWSLLNRRPVNSDLLHRPAFDLLVHELTHQSMSKLLWKMEPWLVEGTAEYLSAAHLAKGRFNFVRIEAHIRDHLRNRTPSKGGKVPAMSIKKLLALSSRDWLTRTAQLPPDEALHSYTTALLLTHYAFHGGDERRKVTRLYLEALEKITQHRDEKPVLFPPTEAPKIESQLKAFWAHKGLQLNFQ